MLAKRRTLGARRESLFQSMEVHESQEKRRGLQLGTTDESCQEFWQRWDSDTPWTFGTRVRN